MKMAEELVKSGHIKHREVQTRLRAVSSRYKNNRSHR